MKAIATVVLNLFLLTGAAGFSARPQSRFVQVNGIRLHYLEWGSHGSPIVLVHGMYDTARVWSAVAPKTGIDPKILQESQQHIATVAEQKLSNGKMIVVRNARHWI
jgi:hypothetical protein